MALRYAQESGGQKLHLVAVFHDGAVANRALCGRSPDRRGRWRMTINAPLGHACKNCCRIFNQMPQGMTGPLRRAK